MITRHKFTFSKVSVGTTALTDTGSTRAYGTLEQVRWAPNGQDTGPGPLAAVTVFLQDEKNTDTGLAHVVYQRASSPLGNDFLDSLADTGTGRNSNYIMGGELLKARLTPVDTGAIDGNLFVYVKD